MNDLTSWLGLNPHIAKRVESDGGLVLAVRDQLLVAIDALPDVLRQLHASYYSVTGITSFLAGLPSIPGAQDVSILQLSRRGAWDVFELTRQLRAALAGTLIGHPQRKFDPRDVSPNHVLIPAPDDSHSCPFGPPHPLPPGSRAGTLPPPTQANRTTGPRVTVIDSGYYWDDGAWPPNPLAAVPVQQAQGAQPGWPAEPLDVLSVSGDDVLGALIGHANFVAGLIAQLSPNVRVLIRNHNGGIDPTSEAFPTEAAVARSVAKSAGSDVIHIGFAFRTMKDVVSRVWDAAFQAIPGTPVTVPAGNRRSPRKHYPAAFATNPGGLRYQNVIGVASVNRPRTRTLPNGTRRLVFKRSRFSNYGRWVTCAAVGSNVRSTFLHLKMRVQDDPEPRPIRDFTATDWAVWNGTSFSAPKVAAKIANLIAQQPTGTVNGAAAWTQLKDKGTRDSNGQLGLMFPF